MNTELHDTSNRVNITLFTICNSETNISLCYMYNTFLFDQRLEYR